jgi:hypothetical protein
VILVESTPCDLVLVDCDEMALEASPTDSSLSALSLRPLDDN